MARLKRENSRLKKERDFLRETATFFANSARRARLVQQADSGRSMHHRQDRYIVIRAVEMVVWQRKQVISL